MPLTVRALSTRNTLLAERAPSQRRGASARCVTCGSCARISCVGEAALSEVTAVHVYSIHLRAADTAVGVGHALWSADARQAKEPLLSERRPTRVPEQHALVDRVRRRHDRLPGHRMPAASAAARAAAAAARRAVRARAAAGLNRDRRPSLGDARGEQQEQAQIGGGLLRSPGKGQRRERELCGGEHGRCGGGPAKKQAPERPGTLNALFGGAQPATSAGPPASGQRG